MEQWKYIRITEEVHDKLTGLGKKGESYDQILRRVLPE